MALLQTVRLEHLPHSHEIHIALFRDITNASFLQQQLLDGNTDFEYALIDAGVVSIAATFAFSCASDT
jgi:EKC/KEOPS complex subunit CGI121/TPRKB